MRTTPACENIRGGTTRSDGICEDVCRGSVLVCGKVSIASDTRREVCSQTPGVWGVDVAL